MKASRLGIIIKFVKKLKKYEELCYQIDYWREDTIVNYELIRLKIDEILGENVASMSEDESIEEKLSYFKGILEDQKEGFWNEAEKPLKWCNYEDEADFIDSLNYNFEDWNSTYDSISKVNKIIEDQVKLDSS